MADAGMKLREQLRLGPLTIEPATRRLVHDDGREEILEPRVIQLLAVLVKADGAILSRDDLVDLCWNGRAIGDDAVFRALSRLRHATEGIAAGVFRLETIPKAGYRLIRLDGAPAGSVPSVGQSGAARAPAIGRRTLMGGGVALGAAALAGSGWWVMGTGPAAEDQFRRAASHPARLAVLPFRAVDGTPAFLAHGLARELVDEAGRIQGLEAVGAVSSHSLPPEQRTAVGAANALGATMVLAGEMAATSDIITVTAHLMSAPKGDTLWSETVTGLPSELFRLRKALLTRVAETAGASGRPAPWREVDPEALRLYFQAQAPQQQAPANPGVDTEALLDRAVGRDPGFAEAWSALGAARLFSTYRSWLIAPRGTVFDRDGLTSALAAAGRASALRSDFAAPFATNASAMVYLGAWAEALRAVEAAMVRGGTPSATLLRMGQRREAVSVARAWARLDPLNGQAQFALGQSLRLVGDYAAAAQAGERAFALMPMTDCFYDLMMQLIGADRLADARRLLDSSPSLLAAALVQYAPITRDWFLFLMGEVPPPNPDEILARMELGHGFHEMAAIMFAQMGALRHGAMMLDRMGPYDVPVIHMIFGEDCAPLRRLSEFGRLMQRIGLAAFWREGDHWPDFRFTLDERVGRGAAPASTG